VQQYLMLGAGFDTFSYRQPSWASDLQIFEIDHPATHTDKLSCLSRVGLKPPGNVSFHSIDFEEASLAQGLANSGFSIQKPSFVSWLGVTMNLSRPAIEETFCFVLSLPRPSRIVFTFFRSPSSIEDLSVREQTESIVQLAERHGEPMVSLFEPRELEDWLYRLGFSQVRHFTADEAQDLYYGERSDGLSPYTAGQNMCAEV
jgi:methyltransferase (TIGR00027 family)